MASVGRVDWAELFLGVRGLIFLVGEFILVIVVKVCWQMGQLLLILCHLLMQEWQNSCSQLSMEALRVMVERQIGQCVRVCLVICIFMLLILENKRGLESVQIYKLSTTLSPIISFFQLPSF